MQKKNDDLISKLQLLESGIISGKDEKNPFNFELPGKRKPAPRLFCDICDEFDLHETEDCPLQCSDSPPASMPPRDPNRERIIPAPRKYCESCGVFGHEIGECDDDETY